MGRVISTLAMVLVLAGLAGYIYFADGDSAGNTTTKEKAFGTVAADDIEEVRIALNEEMPARLTRSPVTWRSTGWRRPGSTCRSSSRGRPRPSGS